MNNQSDGQQKRSSMDRVLDAAGLLGLDIEILTMDRSTRTAEEAAAACGCSVGQIVKSLVFENTSDGSLVLILVSGVNRVDADFLAQSHGLKLDRCDTRKVRDVTGFAIGGVAPIGHLTSIRTFMDEDLLTHEHVWAAAGRPDSVFRVNADKLARVTGATLTRVQPS